MLVKQAETKHPATLKVVRMLRFFQVDFVPSQRHPDKIVPTVPPLTVLPVQPC